MCISGSIVRYSRMHVVRNALGRSLKTFRCRSAQRIAFSFPATTVYSTLSTQSLSTETLFASLWNAKDIVSIRASCSALAEQSKNHKVASPSTSSSGHQRIRLVLASLTESGQAEDMYYIEKVLKDVYPMLGLMPSRADYMFIFQRLLHRGYYQSLNLLLEMKNLPGGFTPESAQFHRLLQQWSKHTSFDVLRQATDAFHTVNPNLSNETFLLLLEARFSETTRNDTQLDFHEISDLVRWCVDRGMTSDPVISSKLYQSFADTGDFDTAQRIALVYESASRLDVDFDDCGATLPSESLSSSSARALEMLRNATAYADILAVSQSLNFSCGAQHYALVIVNCLKSSKIGDAFNIYDKSQEAGVIPTAGMVTPLIKSLYNGYYLESSDHAIDKALEIYQHLSDARPQGQNHGPTAKIYHALIRMVLSSPNTAKYLPVVQSLLFDLEERGHTDNSFLAATKIIVEMRRVGSFAEAVDFYRQHRAQLDQRGFIQVLQEYCRLSFAGDLEVPLITEYFSIISHMRMQNVPLTPKVYTIILHQIGLIATKLRGSTLEPNLSRGGIYQRLVDTTRRIHHFLTLDASISPDAILWNQLMNTYQRLGLYRDMEKLWQTMYLSGRFDQITINVMIDACGYSGNMRFVRSVISKLLKAGHKPDGRNWDTLVEALCRNQHFGEALEVICVEMKRHALEPQVETIRIFQKFARKRGVWNLYKPSIENALPELWSSFPDEFRNT